VLARHGAHDASEAAAHGSAQTPTFLVFRAIRDPRVFISVSVILKVVFWDNACMSAQRPPSGLRTAGKRLWAAVVESFVLNPAEVAMLEQACRTVDELDRLERAVRSLPELTATGSTGQLKPHPLLGEVRAHRQLLERITTALSLPDEGEDVGLRPGQRHARRAVNARWRPQVNGKLAELRGEVS
jgi:hypothetical protein